MRAASATIAVGAALLVVWRAKLRRRFAPLSTRISNAWCCGRRNRLLHLGVLLILASGGGACRRGSTITPRVRHLVVVTIDTLRADRLGVYGDRNIETPHLDRIAHDGAMAPQATAHVPLTRPSHVTLFTGLLPYQTGVRDNLSPPPDPKVPLLAEVLRGAGFETGAFVSAMVLDPSSGLDRGFNTYEAHFPSDGGELQFLGSVRKKGDSTTQQAISWLQGVAKPRPLEPRIFLWLHLYDVHDPYEPPEPYATRYGGRPYDGAVAWTDELVGRFDDALTRLGLRDQTLLLVTSDHGEGLGEHGETLHGFFTYETTLRVPLLIRSPGVQAGTRLGVTVRLVDIFPTVLDMLGVAAPSGAQFTGTNLGPVLRGEKEGKEPVTYAESLVPLLHFGWSDLRVLREGRWKYIQAPRPELYDLQTDPEEKKTLATALPNRVEAARAALAHVLEEERRGSSRAPAAAVPLELLERLGALGYTGGVAPAQTSTPGADPKDRIEDFRLASQFIREGLLRLNAKDYAGSAERFEALVRRGISSFEVHFFLARALLGARRMREADRQFEEATRLGPGYAAAWKGLAESRVALNDRNGGLAALRRGEAAVPGNAELRLAEARLLKVIGRSEEACRAYESAAALAPKSAEVRAELGDLLRDLGAIADALKWQREAVDLEPRGAYYWSTLGMTLGGNGRLAEAEKAFREAWRLDATDHRNAYNLGLILLRQERPGDARPFFEKALQLEPSFTPASQKLTELGPPKK